MDRRNRDFADILTKQGLYKESLDKIIKMNRFRHAQNKDNLVVYEDDEITIKNLVMKEMKNKESEGWREDRKY